jgi:hypothetical protein
VEEAAGEFSLFCPTQHRDIFLTLHSLLLMNEVEKNRGDGGSRVKKRCGIKCNDCIFVSGMSE